MKNRCYVIVQRGFPMGGIETMIIRIAHLITDTDDNLVVCGEYGSMSKLLPNEVDFFPVKEYRDLLRHLPKYLKEKYAESEIVLISLHPWALVVCYILVYLIKLHQERAVRAFHLVTHSRAFFFDTKFHFKKKFLRKIFFSAPQNSVFFMNDAARTAHANEWKVDLSGYGVLRLPLDHVHPIWKAQIKPYLRVVSVGRLVPFKAYNMAAASIISKLHASGISVTWDIWGNGEDKAAIEEQIQAENVLGKLVLRGELPYAKYAETVSDYDVFIGMGTALLEASQYGVPSICAIESDGQHCYGFIYQSPADSVGDVVPGTNRELITDVLLRFNSLSMTERQEVGHLCAENIVKRSNELDQFVEIVHQSPIWSLQFNFTSITLFVLSWINLYLREIKASMRFVK
jgi:glycosyltransferase involved in cell wall biosynthesis